MTEDLRRTLDRLVAIDMSTMDRSGLREVATLINEARSWLDGIDVKVARRMGEITRRAPDTAAGTEDIASTLSGGGRRSQREARKPAARAAVCEKLRALEAALDSGVVSGEHLDGVANAIRDLRPSERARLGEIGDELLSAASTQTPETFARSARRIVETLTEPERARPDAESRLARQKRRAKVTTWVDQATGMHKLLAELDPETAAKVTAALDAKLDELMNREGNADVALPRLRVDALVELVTNQADGAKRVPEVYVHIDYWTLIGEVHQNSLCELNDGIPIPAETARRLCCDADIIPVVLGGPADELDCGRSRRTANREQRRALRALYRTCAHPECAVPFEHCDIHHVRFWEALGRTDIDNLAPLCHRHHHLVHEGRWRLAMSPDRVITLTRPDGTVHFHGSTVDRSPHHGTAPDADLPQRPPGERPAAA